MDIPQERKLVTEIPGPKSREWFARRERAVPKGVGAIHPIVTARASGSIVEDVDGNRLIDFATGIAVLNVGHTAPENSKRTPASTSPRTSPTSSWPSG
jgi:4-aminobutyrate aminotransferase/(S)-3-amino-2-methylpropionate transaminase